MHAFGLCKLEDLPIPLTSELEEKFVAQCSAIGIECHRDSAGIIRFSAPCSDVGDLLVYFYDGEITVDISHITHCHFTPYEAGSTYPENTADDCAEAAAEYVQSVLNGKRVLWRYENGSGGSYLLGEEDEADSHSPVEGESVERFLWSGRYRGAT